MAPTTAESESPRPPSFSEWMWGVRQAWPSAVGKQLNTEEFDQCACAEGCGINDLRAEVSYLRLEYLPDLLNRPLSEALPPSQMCTNKGFETPTSPLLATLAATKILVALLFLNKKE